MVGPWFVSPRMAERYLGGDLGNLAFNAVAVRQGGRSNDKGSRGQRKCFTLLESVDTMWM